MPKIPHSLLITLALFIVLVASAYSYSLQNKNSANEAEINDVKATKDNGILQTNDVSTKYINDYYGITIMFPNNWVVDQTKFVYKDATTIMTISSSGDETKGGSLAQKGQAKLAITRYGEESFAEFSGITRDEFYNTSNKSWQIRKKNSGGGGIQTKNYSLVNVGENKMIKEEILLKNENEEQILLRTNYLLLTSEKPLIVWQLQTELHPLDPNRISFEKDFNEIVSSFSLTQ